MTFNRFHAWRTIFVCGRPVPAHSSTDSLFFDLSKRNKSYGRIAAPDDHSLLFGFLHRDDSEEETLGRTSANLKNRSQRDRAPQIESRCD